MGRFVVRRVAQGLLVVLGVTIVVFVVTRMVGDPVKFILPIEATQQERAERRHELGFDRPIVTQFGDYMGDLARFDFGDSLWQRGGVGPRWTSSGRRFQRPSSSWRSGCFSPSSSHSRSVFSRPRDRDGRSTDYS